MSRTVKLLAAIVSCLPTVGFGHPGHGTPALESTVFHWLEPQHVVFPVAIIVAAGLIWWSRSQKSR